MPCAPSRSPRLPARAAVDRGRRRAALRCRRASRRGTADSPTSLRRARRRAATATTRGRARPVSSSESRRNGSTVASRAIRAITSRTPNRVRLRHRATSAPRGSGSTASGASRTPGARATGNPRRGDRRRRRGPGVAPLPSEAHRSTASKSSKRASAGSVARARGRGESPQKSARIPAALRRDQGSREAKRHGQYAGAPPDSHARPHALTNPASDARSATSDANRDLPMPGSPTSATLRPWPRATSGKAAIGGTAAQRLGRGARAMRRF
jgi:hypothetical protein